MRRALLLAAAVTGAALAASAALGDDLPAQLDVAGRRGQDGRDGANGAGAGRDGGHAGPSTPGEHGGSLDLVVEVAPTPGRFLVTGTSTPARPQGAAPGAARAVSLDLSIGERGALRLLTGGGDGGRGGDGGDGARGRDGSDGSDATCSRRGTDGGDGGAGGDGGDATSGSDGGAGGSIRIALSGSDTHLLLLLEPRLQGGKGGRKGENGKGAQGGRGGRGGSRHSSHGSKNNRCSGNSGGSRGSDGRHGRTATAAVAAGADGADGPITYVVDGVEYPDRYRLALEGFAFDSENQDGVFEPGEEVIVREVAVVNRGGVPTPRPQEHPTEVFLLENRSVSRASAPLPLPVVLAAGERAVVPGALRFTIPDVEPAVIVANQRHADEGSIDPRARIPDARRDHPETVNPQRFPISFPLVVRPVRFGSAIGAGESRRVVLEVENVSSRPFGADQAEPLLRRGVQLTVHLDGRSLDGARVSFVDPDGRAVDLATSRYAWDVGALRPGETKRVEVQVGVHPDATPYTDADLAVDLHLGRIRAAPDDRRTIERRRIPMRVASRWQPPARPGVVLVTNVGVPHDVVEAWRALLADLGLGLAIWDVSYYGFLPLGAARAERVPALLMEAARGHAVVVLNNAFESPLEDADGRRAPARASSFLSPDEVARAAWSAGARVLLVGGEAQPSLADLLLPLAEAARTVEHASADALLDALAAPDAAPDHDALHRVAAVESFPWGRPSHEGLSGEARALAARLDARWPERSYVVVPRFDPALDDGTLWNDIRHGTLYVRRMVDGADALLVADAELATADYVRQPQLLTALLGALPFARKLELLAAHLEGALPAPGAALGADVLGPALAEALLADLQAEVAPWLRTTWSGGSLSGTYRERLTRHAGLAALRPARAAAPGSAAAECALRVASVVEARARSQWGLLDVVVPFAARRYYVTAATAGTAMGSGLIDEFAAAALGEAAAGEVARRAQAPPSAAAPRWKHLRGAHTLSSYAGCVVSNDALLAAQGAEEERAAARARFLEALDRLRMETELSEGMGPR